MTDFEFEILKAIHSAPGNYIDETELKNKFIGRFNDAVGLINNMRSDEYIEPFGSSSVRLSDKGTKSYILEKELRENRSKENAAKDAEKQADALEADKNLKKQFRHDFIVAAVGGIITLLAEHFPKIIKALIAFLK